MSERYRRRTVPHEEHVQNSAKVSEAMSRKHGRCLLNGRFRIGVAQKALNLYLKYLWCLGEVTEPPDCPFDRIVISALEGCDDVNWTQFDDLGTYERLVKAAREIASEKSLAAWELEYYSR